jgi:hypothetical protein
VSRVRRAHQARRGNVQIVRSDTRSGEGTGAGVAANTGCGSRERTTLGATVGGAAAVGYDFGGTGFSLCGFDFLIPNSAQAEACATGAANFQLREILL